MSADAHEFLDIPLRPSRVLCWVAVTTYCLAGASLIFANIPIWALGALWLMLYFQAVMQWRRIRTPLYPFELTRLRWRNNQWLVTLGSVCDDSPWQLIWLRIIPYFIFLRFKPVGAEKSGSEKSSYAKPRSLLIVKDQLTEKDYRQLLLWLQMRPLHQDESR